MKKLLTAAAAAVLSVNMAFAAFAAVPPESLVTGPNAEDRSGDWEKAGSDYYYHFGNGVNSVDGWLEIDSANGPKWYHFNGKGIMDTGWFCDNGNYYYLSIAEGDDYGSMHTGWHYISDKWYYFHEEGDGFLGTLLVDGETPDGYTVDINGALVE